MELTNLNIFTFLVFIGILGFISFVGYKVFLEQKKFNNIFFLLKTNNFFYIKYVFLIISFLIILFSIFKPKLGDISTNNNINSGIDIMFVLDVSKSMQVGDITDGNYNYTRLDVMKDSISKFVSKHKEDRFGLVIFAGDAISTIPLTTDHDIFLTFLSNIDYRNLTIQGSDFEKAIKLGIERFIDSDGRSKAMIFVSDGGDSDYKVDTNLIKNYTKKIPGINYYVVGVGTEKGGKIISGRDVFGRLNYQQYNGEDVISKLNQGNLKSISNVLKGEYIHIGEVNDIFSLNKFIDNLYKKALITDINGEKIDAGRVLTFISFIFFSLFFIMYIFENKIYKLIKEKGRKK